MKKVGTPDPISQDCKDIQLSLFPDFFLFEKSAKPQIKTISGIHLSEPKKYQITIGGRVVATRLTLDEAIALAKGGK